MSEQPPRDFGRDGVSGLVDKERALRARLLGAPRRTIGPGEQRDAPPVEPGPQREAPR
uniref:hypothetical protein n=1 Tax=Tessaracoccus bendigoensis TaxID=72764 RepID=UPI0015881639|nr:hypothetical protein [Tessaracoccus bendigoensis]